MTKAVLSCLMLFMVFAAAPAESVGGGQGAPPATRPALLSLPMPDFTLPAVQGGDYGISKLKGKNVLLVFPRGKVADHWCQICHYQYLELAELEHTLGLRKKYNLEVLFVLPYDQATVEHWVAIFPDQLAVIEGWKNPPEPEKLNDRQKAWMQTARRFFPKSFDLKKDAVPTPFPVLVDADRTVSKGLGLFTMNWDGSQVDQNIPTVFLLDGAGNVVFKYMSQTTFDRPSAAYLLKFLDRMLPVQ